MNAFMMIVCSVLRALRLPVPNWYWDQFLPTDEEEAQWEREFQEADREWRAQMQASIDAYYEHEATLYRQYLIANGEY